MTSKPHSFDLDGLLATRDSLFVAEITTGGDLNSGARLGVIYQIKSLVSPTAPSLSFRRIGVQVELTWARGMLQEAPAINGPWKDVSDVFSPCLLQPTGPGKLFRTRY